MHTRAHAEPGGRQVRGIPSQPAEHSRQPYLRGVSGDRHQGERLCSSSSSSDSFSPKPIIPSWENDSLAQQPPSAAGRGAGRWPWGWPGGGPGTHSRRVWGGQRRGINAVGTVASGVAGQWMRGEKGKGGHRTAGPVGGWPWAGQGLGR